MIGLPNSNEPPISIEGTLKLEGKAFVEYAQVPSLGVEVKANFQAEEKFIRAKITAKNLRKEQRLLTVYFALPIMEGDWTWWEDMNTAVTIPASVIKGADFGNVTNRYPIGVVTCKDKVSPWVFLWIGP